MQISFYKQCPNNWDKIVREHAQDGGLLQSQMWANFQQHLGRKIEFIRISDNDKFLLQCLLVQMPLKKNLVYFFAPRGPIVLKEKRDKTLQFFFAQIKEYAKNNKALWFAIEPPYSSETINLYPCKKTKNIDPQDTLVIDINKPEEKLIQEMHPKTRYNIRLSEKKGVVIEQTSTPTNKEIDIFYHLLSKTQERQNFGIYNKIYFYNLFEALKNSKRIFLFTAKHNNTNIASAVVIHWNNFAYYLYGGSDYKYRKLMAPHLLHWKIINHAKKNGILKYDMWGVQPTQKTRDKEKAWAGITRFKKHFSPQTKTTSFVGTYEYTYKPILKNIYSLAKKIKTITKNKQRHTHRSSHTHS